MIKNKKILGLIIALSLFLPNTFIKADELNINELVNNAINQRSFYYFNVAYAKVTKLEDGSEKDNLLSKLSSVSDLIWSEDIKNINNQLTELSNTGSAKIYDDVQEKISKANIPEVDKAYLLGEATSWGKDKVWTDDYKKAVESVVKAYKDKTIKSVNESKAIVNQIKNERNRIYLMSELSNISVIKGNETATTSLININETYDKNKVGNITGAINYQKKSDSEMVLDLGASVAFIPMTSFKNIDDEKYMFDIARSLVPSDKIGNLIVGKYGIYSSFNYKNGYEFKSVPAGKYYVIIRSFNSKHEIDDIKTSEYDILKALFNEEYSSRIRLMLLQYKYTITTVEIKENETTILNHNFLYTDE